MMIGVPRIKYFLYAVNILPVVRDKESCAIKLFGIFGKQVLPKDNCTRQNHYYNLPSRRASNNKFSELDFEWID